jgi:hypothetical protein
MTQALYAHMNNKRKKNNTLKKKIQNYPELKKKKRQHREKSRWQSATATLAPWCRVYREAEAVSTSR